MNPIAYFIIFFCAYYFGFFMGRKSQRTNREEFEERLARIKADVDLIAQQHMELTRKYYKLEKQTSAQGDK